MGRFPWWPRKRQNAIVGNSSTEEAEESRDPRQGGKPSREKQPNEWLSMLSRLQTRVRERTEILLKQLEDQKFTEIQLQNLAHIIADDMSALVATAQAQADIVRNKGNRTPVDMGLALGAFGEIVSELDASTSRYAQGFELTDPRLASVVVRPVGDQTASGLLVLPSPDSQPGLSGRTPSSPQQVVGANGMWTPQQVALPKRVVSGKAEKLAKELEDTYAKLLDSARSVLVALAGRRITRIEVRTAINKIQTLQLWLVGQQRQMLAKYAVPTK